MKPSDFQKTVQCRFESCLKKVVRHVVKDYQQKLKRRQEKETLFCELPEIVVENLAVWDDYETDYTIFNVCGYDIRVYDDELAEALRKLQSAQKNPVNKICLLLVFSVPTERAAIATGNDLRGLGICHQQALAGIPETGFLLNTQSYVRLHCLPVVLRVFGRGSVYSCRIDKPLITAYNRVIILNCYNREMQKNKIFCPL